MVFCVVKLLLVLPDFVHRSLFLGVSVLHRQEAVLYSSEFTIQISHTGGF